MILVACQGLAMVWLGFEWMIGVARLRGLARRGEDPDERLAKIWEHVAKGRGRFVCLRVTEEIATPLVSGWRKPVVLIPKAIANGEASTLRFCLAHEWSHIAGNDLVKWRLINLLQLLFWFQPMYWKLRRELRICQDLIADDHAAGIAGNPTDRIEYSQLLLTIAKQAVSPSPMGAIAFYEGSSQLSRRIQALLTNQRSLHRDRRGPSFGLRGAHS